MFLAILFPLMGLLSIIGAFIYMKVDEKNKNKKTNKSEDEPKEGNPKQLSELKEFIGISDIKNNKIKLKDGGTRVILSISSSDFELLTDEEQINMENALIQFGLSLGYSVQFFTTPTRIEVKGPTLLIEDVINSADDTITQELKEYSTHLLYSLKNLENERGTYVRRSFCIIGVDIDNEKKADNEIEHRLNTIASKLSRARMRVSLLNSEQIAQLLTDILQKGSNVLISQLIQDGSLELYSEGSGLIVIDEK